MDTLTGDVVRIQGRQVELVGECKAIGKLDLTGGSLQIDGTTEFEIISADDLTTTGNVTTSGNVQGTDVIATGDASVGGDLNVVGALNAALQLPVHIVSDTTRRTIQAADMPIVLSALNYSALIQSKQPLIETTASGFKIKESGLYLFYYRYHCYSFYSQEFAKTRFIKNGTEIHVDVSRGVPSGNKDVNTFTVCFDNAEANDLITVDFAAGSSSGAYVTTVMTYAPALQALFGAIKLA